VNPKPVSSKLRRRGHLRGARLATTEARPLRPLLDPQAPADRFLDEHDTAPTAALRAGRASMLNWQPKN
jgi:hypothetical protein